MISEVFSQYEKHFFPPNIALQHFVCMSVHKEEYYIIHPFSDEKLIEAVSFILQKVTEANMTGKVSRNSIYSTYLKFKLISRFLFKTSQSVPESTDVFLM